MPSHITYYNQIAHPAPRGADGVRRRRAAPLRHRVPAAVGGSDGGQPGRRGQRHGQGRRRPRRRGVSLHVYGVRDGEALEHLRFDCFDEDPHYHYISWTGPVERDAPPRPHRRTATRSSGRWSGCAPACPRCWRTPGAADIAAELDQRSVDAVLPRVTEAAYRSRYHHDDNAILADALKPG